MHRSLIGLLVVIAGIAAAVFLFRKPGAPVHGTVPAADSGQIGHSFRFISDSHSDDIGHPRSEATLAGWICIIGSPMWVKSIFGCDPVGTPLAG